MSSDSEEFIGDLCVEDLPNASLEDIELLALPCKEYLKHTSDYLTPAVAPADSSLKSIIDIMIKDDTHRVWILDASKKVIGVITMSDIMSLLILYRKPSLF